MMRRSWSTEDLGQALQGDSSTITKGPEARACLACARNKKSLVKESNLTEDEVKEVGKDQSSESFRG